MTRQRTTMLLGVFLFAAALLPAPPASAQAAKLGRAYHADEHNGFRFRYPKDWLIVPVQSFEMERGLIGKMKGPDVSTKIEGEGVYLTNPELGILKLDDFLVLTQSSSDEVDDEGGGEETEPIELKSSRPDIADVIALSDSGLQDFDKDEPFLDKEKTVHKIPARHRAWTAHNGLYPVVIDTWSYHLSDFDIVLIYEIPEQHRKKWLKVFDQSGKTFETIERVASSSVSSSSSYDEQLAYHREMVARTPGWKAVPTPSQKFIVKTSSDDKDFVSEVIDRLERSREIYERDFPPKGEFGAISVVRICGTEDEFHAYGGTGRGVAGWFNPLSVELVIYDGKDIDRNMSYSVMSHEAFHQYCHFLFEQSEAHRWFDEGHGDYYGGVEFKHGKAKITPRMPAGLNRLGVIREMIRDESYAPLWDHLNYTHREWQSQGPTHVSCYAQSWSIVYFLRQGMLGKVPRKIWKKEYAEIVPSYTKTLYDGFMKAYGELREEALAEAKEKGEELDPDELSFDRSDLDEEVKEEIWKAAMEASWGDIDLDEFEESWKIFVKKHV